MLLALLALPLAFQTQPAMTPAPRALLARALDAMGGVDAARAIRNTVTDFNSTNFALGQEETPASPPRATLATGRIVQDWAGMRRVQMAEIRPVAAAPTRQRRVTAGGIGMLETDGRQAVDAPAQVAGVLRGMTLQPHALLLAAFDSAARVTPLAPRRYREETMDGLRYAGPTDTLSLWFDRRGGLLVVSEALTDDPILGDRRTLTWYTRWQDAGAGVKLPRQVDTEVNGRLLSHNVATSIVANAPIADSLFMIPDSIAGRATRVTGPVPPAPVTVTLRELAPDVWRAEGGTHHSLVVSHGTTLTVVEAPQTAARMNAVLDTLRARFPSARVGTVVNTHHHWDHAGGVRVALAAGHPVVTHGRNAGFVRRIAVARKTVSPDALSRRGPRGVVIRAVEDSAVIGTGDRRVVIYSIASIHAEGILAAYVPAHQILFVSDVMTANPAVPPAGARELVAFARARGLTIGHVAGGHGNVVAWSDVEAAAQR